MVGLAYYGTTVAGVDKHAVVDSDSGTKIVQGVSIFKAGSFKDSVGELRTWTVEQLAIMVSNFGVLREADRLVNVPVRSDHSWTVESVIGYIKELRVEGDFLLADIEFTEPAAFEKFDRGTYRSRSLEVGEYEDNDQVVYWPVVMGLAFVDIPAVEGLHRGPVRVGSFRYSDGEESTMPDSAPKEPFKFTIGGHETVDYAAVQAHVAKVEGEYAALKTRNDTLEAFANEQVKANRLNFVTSLVSEKKIGAPQKDGLDAFVQTMSDEQFEAFKGVYANAPVLSLFGAHTETITNPGGEQSADTAVDIAKETVDMLVRSGMDEPTLHKTDAYKKYAALTNGK